MSANVSCAFLIVWIAIGGIVARAQQPSSLIVRAEEVDELLQSAETLLRAQQHTQALGSFERALEGARRLRLEMQEAHALVAVGEIEFGLGRYAHVRDRAIKSVEIYERLAGAASAPALDTINSGVGRSNLLLSMILEREGNDRAQARQRAERAIAAYEAAGDRRGRAAATLQLVRGIDLGEQERALSDRTIADARAVSDRVLEARALHTFGDHLFNTGSYAESLEKLQAAAALFEATGSEVALGTTYNSLGRVYRAHGRLDAALASQLKALAIHEKSDAPFSHLQSVNAVAVTYEALGDTSRARIYFERALALAEQSSTPRIQDFLRANFAAMLLEDGEYQRVVDLLEGVIARGLDAYPSLRMGELSYALSRLGRHDAALVWAQKAVEACGNRETATCIWMLDRRAEAHAGLGNDEAALADLQAAMTRVESMRSRLVPADFFKQQFHLAQEGLYSHAIKLQVRGGRFSEALETAERARARAFIDLLASRDLTIAPSGGVQHDGIPRGATASIDAEPLVFRGAPRSGPDGPTSADALLSDTVVPAASLKDLVATAGRLGSTLVAYWVARDQVFIWVASANGAVRVSQVAVRPSKLLELIRATTPFSADGPTPAERRIAAVTTRGAASIAIQAPASQAWRELYDLLIKPVRDALPRSPGALLTIVPHGPLGALSFAGLQDERGQYLLERFTLHYAPAGAALQFTAARRRPAARQGRMLMVADPVPPTLSNLDNPLPRLPGARDESRAIAALIPRARIARFEGEAARERDVREASANKAVLHFATHAIVRDDDPFSSFLALSRSGDDDGLLTAQEIYRLRLDADLVVLSACRSAGGRVTGDGIATFARAFLYAGAPSVVASLWDVADEPTNRLIPDFYRSWLAGASKARALRAAQLTLLKELRSGRVKIDTPAGLVSIPEHPVFWAGFALIGEPH